MLRMLYQHHYSIVYDVIDVGDRAQLYGTVL